MIGSLIYSNYDINVILLSIKILTLIYYIIKYATKGNCNQYQGVIAAALIKKAYKDLEIRFSLANTISRLDKFSLKAFNQLSYNWNVNWLLVTSFLLDLPDYYFPIAIVKTNNIAFVKTKLEVILSS